MRLALLAYLGLIALLAACGGAPTRTLPNGSPVAVVDQECADRIKPLYDKLHDLDGRMDVGLTRPDYNNRLGDIRVVYNDVVDAGTIPSGACFDSAKKLEDALNQYITANGTWGDCIADVNCTVDTDALPKMRLNWSRASDLLDEVRLALP